MRAILLVLSTSFGVGLGLASLAGRLPLPAGLIGVSGMVLMALAIRRRWGLLAEAAPGTPERQLWVSLSGTSVVTGHLLGTLWHIGPNMVMHTSVVHALGIDSWTLVAGATLAYLIAREPQPRRDERDDWIATRGLRAGHFALVAVLIVQLLTLGFVSKGWVAELSHPAIAHGLILALMVSTLFASVARLRLYAQDASAGDGFE